jgi:hypothetical protein
MAIKKGYVPTGNAIKVGGVWGEGTLGVKETGI